jgi:predicted membrane protein
MMGFLDNARWLFMILSTVAIIGILVFMFWKKPQNKILLIALTLVTAGGIGNMVDRISLGYVVDFIDFCAFPELWKWTFNFADSCVTVGAAMLALWMLLDVIKDYKLKKAAALAAGRGEESLTALERAYVSFADDFEKNYIGQGFGTVRSTEETLGLGRALLEKYFPKN